MGLKICIAGATGWVEFGAKDECLTIRHDAGSGADPYIQGTLLAIRKVRNQTGLVRGLDKIME